MDLRFDRSSGRFPSDWRPPFDVLVCGVLGDEHCAHERPLPPERWTLLHGVSHDRPERPGRSLLGEPQGDAQLVRSNVAPDRARTTVADWCMGFLLAFCAKGADMPTPAIYAIDEFEARR
jgi:hypothetical protein